MFFDNSELRIPHSELDAGFRVLKLDTSNMKDVYYYPEELEQGELEGLIDNIREDRTAEDLLFQVMLDMGIDLSSKIEIRNEEIGVRNYTYFEVADGNLTACFDDNLPDELIVKIVERKPSCFVMRDSGFGNDSVATNFEQIFKAISPDTKLKIL